MKRIRLWLRELSLTPQLVTILFLVISVLTIFIFAFLTPGINQFTSAEMYRMLHAAHIRAAYYVDSVNRIDQVVFLMRRTASFMSSMTIPTAHSADMPAKRMNC